MDGGHTVEEAEAIGARLGGTGVYDRRDQIKILLDLVPAGTLDIDATDRRILHI